MEVLTTEMFEENVCNFRNNYNEDKDRLTFKNYLVNVFYSHSLFFFSYGISDITFEKCTIENMRIPWPMIFKSCKILDYKNISSICGSSFKDCTFEKPVPLACPEKGEFIGYKKCKYWDKKEEYYENCIVKLLVPADAKRSSSFGRKCRCSKAKVLDFYDVDGHKLTNITFAESYYRLDFSYKVGEWVYPNKFDENRFNECSNGIHFFMTFDEARDYYG